MKNFIGKNWIAILIVLIIAVVAIGYVFGVNLNDKTWVKVESKEVQEAFMVSGNVEALNKNNLTAPIPGKISEVFVKEGDNVKKGQVLARYEKVNYQAQLESGYAVSKQALLNYKKLSTGNRTEEINRAKALYLQNISLIKEKELAYLNFKKDEIRYKTLHDKKMLTPKEYEDYQSNLNIAQTAYESQKFASKQALEDYILTRKGFRIEDISSAREEVNKSKAQLAQIKNIYDKTDVKSPIDGIITKKFVNPGNNVQIGEKLFDITDKSNLEIDAKIEEEDIQNVKHGDMVDIEADAYPKTPIKGKVIKIVDQVDESVKLLTLKIIVKENKQNKKLLPGMTVSCSFAGHPVTYLLVPKKAVFFEGKKAYLETDYGKVYVLIGKEHDSKVIVKGNINEGDKVLVE